jgi:hypothetical protein
LAEVRSGAQALAFTPNADAVRDGSRVVLDRGSMVEDYVIGLESLEQRFTFSSLPSREALVVRLDVTTELSRREEAAGFRFENELGAATYSRAFVLDAAGRKQGIETRLENGQIALEVPAAFLATAEFPITIDPIGSTHSLDVSTEESINADIAYDGTLNRYMVSYENWFSSTDHDLFVSVVEDHVVTGFLTLEFTSADWRNPAIANNNIADNFLVVAQVGTAPNRIIRGRTCSGFNLAAGPFITISGAESGDKLNPDVGGDPNLAPPTYYCVVWQRDFNSTDEDVHARLVRADSTFLGGVVLLENSASTIDRFPSISKTNGVAPAGSQEWNIVWQHQVSATNEDVQGARIHWNGDITDSTFTVASTIYDETLPTASAPLDPQVPNRPYLVAYSYAGPDNAGDLRLRAFNGTSTVDTLDLVSGTLVAYGSASVDVAGNQFAVAHTSSFNTDIDVRVRTIYLYGSTLGLGESATAAGSSTVDERRPSIVSTHTSATLSPRHCEIVYDYEYSATDHDIYITSFTVLTNPVDEEYCFGDGTGTNCPCGNNGAAGRGCANSANPSGARLIGTGVATIADDTFRIIGSGMPPTATCLYFQGTVGTNAGLGTVFGDGLRCASGTVIRLGTRTNSGGVSAYGYPTDTLIHIRGLIPASGGSRYYQGWYRNSANFCTPSGFNLTNGLHVVWLP